MTIVLKLRRSSLLVLVGLIATSGVSAAVPSKPLLKPQTLHTDDMVLAPDPADDPAELLARYLRILAEPSCWHATFAFLLNPPAI